ncbi:MAG: hypothetical protein ACRD2E_07205 [Terriglobales bacterium]
MRPSSVSRLLLWSFVAVLSLFVAQAQLQAGTIGSGNDPRIQIGGGTADAQAVTFAQFSFYVTDSSGTSGFYGNDDSNAGSADCYEGAAGGGTLVPGCAFYNDTGTIISAISVSLPANVFSQEDFTCSTAFADQSDSAFDACLVDPLNDSIVFFSVPDDPWGQWDADDFGLLPGQSFVISVDPWPDDVAATVTDYGPGGYRPVPEPPAGALVLLGFGLLAMSASWQKRRAQRVTGA